MKKLFSRHLIVAMLVLIGALGGVAYAFDKAKTVVDSDTHYFQGEVRLNGGAKVGADFLMLDSGTLAASGPTGASGVLVTHEVTGVSATTGGLSVTLPTAVKGLTRVVGNQSASTVSLYPYTGDAINASSANTALSVATGKVYICVAPDVDHWLCAGN